MAKKRMFTQDVVNSDRFLDLPFNAQLLYYHLGVNGDVHGFVEPKKVIRMVGLKTEDIKPLIQGEFVIAFESGVIVITHWNVHNKTRTDREAPTRFPEELSQLSLNNEEYIKIQDNSRSTPGVLPHKLNKVRLNKGRVGERETKKRAPIKRVSFSSIKSLKGSVLEDVAATYDVPLDFVESRVEDMQNYCDATGKSYKNYKAALSNWVKRDAEESKKGNRYAKRSIDATKILQGR